MAAPAQTHLARVNQILNQFRPPTARAPSSSWHAPASGIRFTCSAPARPIDHKRQPLVTRLGTMHLLLASACCSCSKLPGHHGLSLAAGSKHLRRCEGATPSASSWCTAPSTLRHSSCPAHTQMNQRQHACLGRHYNTRQPPLW